MAAICASGAATATAVADPDRDCVTQAVAIAPEAAIVPSLDAMLELGLDGIVIATPSALHAEQSVAALKAGVSVFCQKPLGRHAAEVERIIRAAREADRLLAVDFSYRHTAAARAIRSLMASGELGQIYAADLVFHNAYGPDKPWFYDKALSGGGCVIDLGVHLVDLTLWALGFPEVGGVHARLYAGGRRLPPGVGEIEDYAVVELELGEGACARLACSWRLHAGCDAVIEATFHGTQGAATLRNVGGSFYEFEALRSHGTQSRVLVSPPDEWGGRAAVAWARQLATDPSFDPQAENFREVAQAIDRIYASAGSVGREPGRAPAVPAAEFGDAHECRTNDVPAVSVHGTDLRL